MFCNQCEQTAKGVACTTRGICGKDEDTAALQDAIKPITEPEQDLVDIMVSQ